MIRLFFRSRTITLLLALICALAAYGGGSDPGGNGGGTTPPTLVSITPTNSVMGVAVNPTVSVIFSEAMNASTINTSTFTLTHPSGVVSGTVRYAGNTATFTPTTSLVSSTTYTATITTGAQDLAGNSMATPYSWNFTTIPTYTINGTVSGLTGTLVLHNNGGDNLVISANGAFIFSTAFAVGTTYNVTVATQPVSQNCTVSNGIGTLAVNVTNVSVRCVLVAPTAPTITLGFGIKQLQLAWSAVSGATAYRVFENPDGVSGYSQVGADLAATSYNHDIALYRRVNAAYFVQACNSAGCTASVTVYVSSGLTQAIGYFKASNPGAEDYFEYAVTLSSDGNTLAVGASGEDSGLDEEDSGLDEEDSGLDEEDSGLDEEEDH